MAKSYYLPSAAAIAVAQFTPAYCAANRRPQDEVLAVEYLDYGIIGGVQITSLSDRLLTVTDVVINDEFSLSLHAPCEKGGGSYLCKGFPRHLPRFGHSFIMITDAPAAPDHIRSLCYGKPVTEVKVSTTAGDFTFNIAKVLVGDDHASNA